MSATLHFAKHILSLVVGEEENDEDDDEDDDDLVNTAFFL